MGRIGRVFEYQFSEYQVNLIATKLQNDYDQDNASNFEVRVDGVLMIPRTYEPTELDRLPELMDPEQSNEIEIRVYIGASNQYDTYQLLMPRSRASEVSALNGPDIEQRISRAVEDTRREFEMKHLRDDNDKLLRELEEFETYADKLETELKEFRGKKLHWGKVNLGELGSVVVEGMLRRNPQWLSGLPGGEALAGVISSENEQIVGALEAGDQSPGESASFAAVEEVTDLSDEQKIWLAYLERIQSDFSSRDSQTLIQIINALSTNPSLVPHVWELLQSPQNGQNETIDSQPNRQNHEL